MNSRKLVRFAAVASLLLASSAAAQGGAQAVDDERPPAEAKTTSIPPQEAGDTSEVLAGQQSTVAAPAAAPQEEKTPPISAAVTVGWGTDFVGNAPNVYNLGFGVRGGYTLGFGLYVGAQAIYYLGGSNSPKENEVKYSGNEILLGVDVGYNLKVDPVIVRPSLSLGLAIRPNKGSGGMAEYDYSDTATDFYLAPGALVTYPIKNFFVGADVRFVEVLAPVSSIEGVTFMAVGGLNFGKRK